MAIRTVAPDMVDVSGGVESGAGIKDQHKVAAFIDNAKTHDFIVVPNINCRLSVYILGS